MCQEELRYYTENMSSFLDLSLATTCSENQIVH